VAQLVNDIQQQGNTITQVLNQVLNLSEEEMRKEVDHD
jgi:methyl-accepting chemotaxis protein